MGSVLDEIDNVGSTYSVLDEIDQGTASGSVLDEIDAKASPEKIQERATAKGVEVTGNPEFKYKTKSDASLAASIKESALTGLSFIADGLDYLNNISRSMIYASVTGGDVVQAASQAAQYKKRVYAEDLRKAVGSKLGVNLEFSQRQGEFDWGDVADFAADVIIDTATDPLTFLSLGANRVIKSAAKAVQPTLIKEGQKELVERAGKRLAEQGGVIKKGKRKEIKITPKPFSAEPTTAIQEGKALGLLEDIEINKMADSVYAKSMQSMGVETAKTAYTGLMSGIFNVAINAEDENSLADIGKNFVLGAAAGTAGRTVAKHPAIKKRVAEIGQGLNDAVGPRKVVHAFVKDATGKDHKITTEIKGWMMGDYAVDATMPARNAAIKIHKILSKAKDDIVKGDAISGATSLQYAHKFDGFISDLRNELWDKSVREMDDKTLASYGIVTKKKSIKDPRSKGRSVATEYPKYSEVKDVKATPLKNHIYNEIDKRYFTTAIENGKQVKKLKPEAMKVWLGDMEPDLTDKVINNLNVWKQATDEVDRVEKALTNKEWEKLIDPDETTSILMEARREGIEKARKDGVTVHDILSYSNIKAAMDMNIQNKGLPFWVMRHGEKGFAHTKFGADKAKKLANTPKQRQALYNTINDGTRDFLGREQLKKFMDNKTLENAQDVISSFEQMIDLTAKKKGRMILNPLQREAAAYTGEIVKDAKPIFQYIKRVNSLVKHGLLLGGYTWIKNNYWSNARSAFSKHGLFGVLDQAQVFNLKNNLTRDIKKIYFSKSEKNLALDFASDEIDEMIELGIIDAAHWGDITKRSNNEELRKYLWAPELVENIKAAEGNDRWLALAERSAHRMSEFLKTKQLGGYIEGMARATTYKRTLNTLKDATYDKIKDAFGKDAAMEAIKKQAAQITNDVFFDYGKLTYWERSFAREIIPFYSFYKQNMFYQSKALLDPEKTKNLATLTRLADGRYYGAEPIVGEEREILPPHLKQSGAILWTDKDGQKKLYFTTSDPASQAYQMLSREYWFKDFIGQINPILKSAIEQMGGYDYFRDEKLSPKELSNDPTRMVKYLFSRGYSTQYIYNAFAKAIGDTSTPVWMDRSGNPVTDSEYVARIDNIFSWMLASYTTTPVQLIGAAKKMEYGKASGWDTMLNLAGPMGTTTLIQSQQARRLEESRKKKIQDINPDYFERLRRANEYKER